MLIGFRSSSSADLASPGGTTTITLPPGVAATDIVTVVFNSNRVALISPNVVTAPDGWTAINSITANNGIVEATLHAFLALGNIANLAFTNSQTVTLTQGWVCSAFTGVDNTTPIDATATPNSGFASGGLTTNAVTIVTQGAWHCIGTGDTDHSGPIASSGFSVADNSAAVNAYAGLLYNTTPKSPGSTGTANITIGVSDPGDVLLGMPFALRPSSDIAVSATGQSLTLAQGLGTPSTAKAVTGQALTVAIGSAVPASAVMPLGQVVEVGQGVATTPNDVVVDATGVSLSVAQGTPVASSALSVTGLGVSVAQGNVTTSLAPPPGGPGKPGVFVVTYVSIGQ